MKINIQLSKDSSEERLNAALERCKSAAFELFKAERELREVCDEIGSSLFDDRISIDCGHKKADISGN